MISDSLNKSRSQIGFCFLLSLQSVALLFSLYFPPAIQLSIVCLLSAVLVKIARLGTVYDSLVVLTFCILAFLFFHIFYFGQVSAITHGFLLAGGPLLYLVINGSCLIRSEWLTTKALTISVLAITALWAVVQYLDDFQRVSGFLIDANAFAAVMYLGSFLLLSRERQGAIHWFVQFILLFALFATFSRSGLGAWWLGVVGFGFIGWRLKSFSLYRLRAYLIVAGVAYLAVKGVPLLAGYEPVSRNFDDLHNLNQRWPMWLSTWELIKQAPWLGSGFGSFALLYPSVRTEMFSAGLVAHNDYLQLLQEGGLVIFLPFMAWVLFHGYLLFRILFLGHCTGDKRRAELACLLVINLALFSHAFLNFIFYTFFLNLMAWLIFARISWLAIRCGLVRRPQRFRLHRGAPLLVALVLCVMTGRYIIIEGANAVYGGYHNKPAVLQRLASNNDLFSWVLRVDPANVPTSEIYLRKLLAVLPELSGRQREKVFSLAWSQVSLVLEKNPLLPVFHTLAGDLLDEGFRLGIEDVPDAAVLHWQSALKVNPGYVPAHLRLAGKIEAQQGDQMALEYLMGKQLVWLNITSWPRAEPYWQEVRRLAVESDAGYADKIEKLIEQSREKVRNLSSLRRYYRQ